MDPISALLGFSRLLVPPRAAPAGGRKPLDALTDLGVDGHRHKAVEAAQRAAGIEPVHEQHAAQARARAAGEPGQPVDATSAAPTDFMEIDDPLMATRMKAIYADSLAISETTRRWFHG